MSLPSTSLATRLAVERLLASADLRPPGLPPAAVLIVRRLTDPQPGRLADGLRAGRVHAAWERAAQQRLADLYRRAARPALGLPPADAEAVLFADESELLACLARDIGRNAAGQRWWWRTLLRSTWSGHADTRDRQVAYWVDRLCQQPHLAPAVLAQLHAWGEAVAVLRLLTDGQARAVLSALDWASPPVDWASPPVDQTAAPAPRLAQSPPLDWASLPAEQTAASAARLAQSPPLDWASPPAEQTAAPAPRLAQSPPLDWASLSVEQAAASVPRLAQSPPPDWASLPADQTAAPAARLAQSPPLDWASLSVEQAAASVSRLAQSTPGLAQSLQSLPTQMGGVLYLINLMVALDLPACYEADWRLASGVGPWGLLQALGQELSAGAVASCDDPLWLALAHLDGRTPDQGPGARLPRSRPRRWPPFNLPAAWSKDMPDALLAAATSGRRRTLADGLHSRYPPLLARWLALALPFIDQRLRLALKLSAEDSLTASLLRLPGQLYVTRAHVDLVASLEHISLPARLAGLDRNPGWLPDFGRVVTFHFV